MHLSSRTTLILSIVIMLLCSSIFLAFREAQQHDPDHQKQWWSVYFVEPASSDNYDIAVENHGMSETFSYVLYDNEVQSNEVTFKVPNGDSITIPIEQNEVDMFKIRIYNVDTSNDKRTLSKKLP